jgi:flagellar hook-length control protein FliK
MRGLEQLSDGGGQVRLRLHPPELGTLQMTLRFEGNQVTAQLEVENRVARDALINNSQILRDKLAEQGFEVERFEVEIQSDSSPSTGFGRSGDGRESGPDWNNSQSRYAINNENRLRPSAVNEGTGGERSVPWVRTKGTLDVSV